jgi:hypothetical protein
VKSIPIGLSQQVLPGRRLPGAWWASALLVSGLAMAQNQPAPQPPPQPAPAPPTAQPAPTTAPTPPRPLAPVTADQKIENMWSGQVYYWKTSGTPELRGGVASIDSNEQFLNVPGDGHRPIGFDFTAPLGKYDRLEISGFQLSGAGTTTATQPLLLYLTPFPVGDVLTTYYKTQNIKVSWNYLMYPAPPTSKFRYKALFEVQYIQTSPDLIAFDDPNLPEAKGTRNRIFPTFGVGFEYVPSARFRIEMRGSGFFVPHHGDIGDTSGSAIYRIGHLEVSLGAKLYHYKTSQQNQDYIVQTIWGPMAGLRWVFKP